MKCFVFSPKWVSSALMLATAICLPIASAHAWTGGLVTVEYGGEGSYPTWISYPSVTSTVLPGGVPGVATADVPNSTFIATAGYSGVNGSTGTGTTTAISGGVFKRIWDRESSDVGSIGPVIPNNYTLTVTISGASLPLGQSELAKASVGSDILIVPDGNILTKKLLPNLILLLQVIQLKRIE
jgi:hypothetical protein